MDSPRPTPPPGAAAEIGLIGLGFAGAAIIDKVAPKLTAIIPSSSGLQFARLGAPGRGVSATGPSGALGPATQNIPVPWSATVTLSVIGLAVLLAIVGGRLSPTSPGCTRRGGTPCPLCGM